MNNGTELYDQQVLDILEKKYHLFLDSPKGEIQMYLVLPPKGDLDKDIETEINDYNGSKSIINMDNRQNDFFNKDYSVSKEKYKMDNYKLKTLSNTSNFLNHDDSL
jgi:hypothetical protein